MSRFKYVKVLNIPGLSICQGFEFQGYRGFNYFRKYDRALGMGWDAIMEGF